MIDVPKKTSGIGAVAGGIVWAAVFAACAIWLHHANGMFAFDTDDAYIYTGYVKMAFTPGAGLFSYNTGQHSAGTTGILFYYLLCGSYSLLRLFAQKSPELLVFNTWLVSGICFTASGAMLGRIISHLFRGLRRPVTLMLILLASACIFSSEDFVWGQVSGMENPLATLLLFTLSALMLSPCPRIGAAAIIGGLLAGTRPDWTPIVCLIPLLLLFRRQWPIKLRLRRMMIAYALLITLLALIVLPLRVAAGQWQPAALGARVELTWLHSPDALGHALDATFNNPWGYALAASWAAAFVVSRRSLIRRTSSPSSQSSPTKYDSTGPVEVRGVLFVPAFITLFLLLHAVSGIGNFSVHDRYISYVWPALVLTYFLAAVSLFLPSLSRMRSAPSTIGVVVGSLAICAVLAIFLSKPALDEISQDTREMLQVSVWPSQWMAANLPPDSVVAMEPAGAIRTYTNFALVDRTGLTTRHYQSFLHRALRCPDLKYGEFLRANHVQYVFDYPANPLYRSRSMTIVKTWTPQPRIHSPGMISLMKIDR